MKPEELFGVGVRLGGVAMLVGGGLDLLGAVLRLSGLYVNQSHTVNQLVIGAVFYALAGAALLCGADLIVRLSYRRH